VIVLGSGGPVPGRRACASHAVLIDGVPRVLVDAGPGAAVRIGEAELDTKALDVVLLTHLHVDHSGDLPGVVKARDLANDGPLSFFIAGPEGRGEFAPTHVLVDSMLGPKGVFAYLAGFKNPLDIGGRDLPIEGSAIIDVLERPGLRIKAVATDHGDAPAIAYRIEHAGHAVVFGGDTALSSDSVANLAAGADLFVANATVREPPLAPAALYRLHAAPSRIGTVAERAHVGAVVLAHLPPAVSEHESEVIAGVEHAYRGPVSFASDCRRVRADGAPR
jgi:ribonuclease BN (tRNA processing enzyme)